MLKSRLRSRLHVKIKVLKKNMVLKFFFISKLKIKNNFTNMSRILVKYIDSYNKNKKFNVIYIKNIQYLQ